MFFLQAVLNAASGKVKFGCGFLDRIPPYPLNSLQLPVCFVVEMKLSIRLSPFAFVKLKLVFA